MRQRTVGRVCYPESYLSSLLSSYLGSSSLNDGLLSTFLLAPRVRRHSTVDSSGVGAKTGTWGWSVTKEDSERLGLLTAFAQ